MSKASMVLSVALIVTAGSLLLIIGNEALRIDAIEKRITALEQAPIPVMFSAGQVLPTCVEGAFGRIILNLTDGKSYICEAQNTWVKAPEDLPKRCSPPATFDGKLYECVAKDTWRLKERK